MFSLLPIAKFGGRPAARLLVSLAAAFLAGTAPAAADAASYIRTLFDATVSAPDDESVSEPNCGHFSPLAKFAAGQHWRSFGETERAAFDTAFCDLAKEALTRLRQRYPDLSLAIMDTHGVPGHDGKSGMAWVRSLVVAGDREWPVDWQVAAPDDAPYLADLKVMGVSLAIMLRGLAESREPSSASEVVKPWRQVLDLALPAPKTGQ